MKKRRKQEKGSNGLPVIAVITAVAFVSVAALGYLWQQTEIHALGRQKKSLELEFEQLRASNERLNRVYAEMCTHGELVRRAREMGLGLAEPHPNQMIKMTEPSLEAQEWAAREPRERTN